MMNYRFRWLEFPWLLQATVEGEITLPEYALFSTERLKYLDGANGQLYIIVDWSLVSEHISPEILKTLASTPSHRHPHSAVMASVGNQTMLRFIASLITRKTDDGTPASTRVFASVEEAESFCRNVGNADTQRATESKVEPSAE